MWRRGGRCNGVSFKGFPQSKNLNRKKRDKSKHSPQKPDLMKGVEELYLCAGLVWSTMDFWSISKVSFCLKSRALKNKGTLKLHFVFFHQRIGCEQTPLVSWPVAWSLHQWNRRVSPSPEWKESKSNFNVIIKISSLLILLKVLLTFWFYSNKSDLKRCWWQYIFWL